MFGSDLIGEMSNEAREVVVVDLVGEGMLGCDENVREQTRLSGRDVGEPAAKRLVSRAAAALSERYLPTHGELGQKCRNLRSIDEDANQRKESRLLDRLSRSLGCTKRLFG